MSIRLNSDNYLLVSDIRKQSASGQVAPSSITSVTAKLLNSARVEIEGSEITLSAVTDSTDDYEGTFPSTLSIPTTNQHYVLVTIVADSLTGVIEYPVEITRTNT